MKYLLTKIKYLFLVLFILPSVGIFFTSCSDDDDVNFSEEIIKNEQLLAVLKSRPNEFTFKNGKLVINDAVLNRTKLDLSNCELSDVSGLGIFPKLEELNLSNNDFGNEFDFNVLPKSVVKIDLRKNKIYEFKNLVDVKYEDNGEESVKELHKVVALYLPLSAKYNMCDILPFYRKNKAAIEKGDIDVKLGEKKFNTLREIPDAKFRDYLKSIFPESNLFVGDKLDINKHIRTSESIVSINFMDESAGLNPEGLQYFLANPFYSAPNVTFIAKADSHIDYMKLGSNIKRLMVMNISCSNINLSDASNLYNIGFYSNTELESIDLSKTAITSRGKDAYSNWMDSNGFAFVNCENLKTIKFPKTKGAFFGSGITNCPKLEELDLTCFEAFYNLSLSEIPVCKIIFPEVKYWINEGEKNEKEGEINFEITKEVYEKAEVKAFISKYKGSITASNYDWTDAEASEFMNSKELCGLPVSSSVNYFGDFDEVSMNGSSKNPVTNKTAECNISNSKVSIHVAPMKIGKMPLKIEIHAKDLSLFNGKISGKSRKSIITKAIFGFSFKKFDAEYSGNISDSNLSFACKSLNATFMGISFDTYVHFKGVKK